MPLTEASDDEAVLSGASIKTRQHLPATPFELCLKISRLVIDLRRINEGLAILQARLLKTRLGARGGGDKRQGQPARRGRQKAKCAQPRRESGGIWNQEKR